jgi:hypothetical protein
MSNISLDIKYISLEVECAKYLLCEKNYTGQQLDSITELKKELRGEMLPSTYQNRTINDFLIR